MAVRLNVIMVHSPPPSASAQRLNESVVGELIGLAGIDLALVGPLSSMPDSSTDRLTLESIDGDVAVLDWQTAADTLGALDAIGFTGRRAPHQHDPEAAAVVQGRRVYAFDLRRFDEALEVCGALTELKASRQIRTVTLGGVPDPRPNPRADSRQSSTAQPVPPATHPSPTPPDRTPPAVDPQPNQRLNLDELVDELDRLDP